jgi:cytoskeletal protein CcmA (bactofilin family)
MGAAEARLDLSLLPPLVNVPTKALTPIGAGQCRHGLRKSLGLPGYIGKVEEPIHSLRRRCKMSSQAAPAESFVARDLLVEGTLKGHGSLRVAGQVKGTVSIAGEVVIEPGALVNGDVKAARVTVAPGARMRGSVEFGWNEP